MSTKIKICGIKREVDVDYANELRPDLIGFVFAESKRKITPEWAKRLREKLTPEIIAVGVFVNAKQEEILSLVEEKTIQMIQLHGQEDEQYLEQLRRNTDIPVIKGISMHEKLKKIEEKDRGGQFYLFDAKSAGSGTSFDWNFLPLNLDKPFFLAGGLGKENIERAMVQVKPYGIDISSGVETAGEKDFHKMKELIQMVRQMAYKEKINE